MRVNNRKRRELILDDKTVNKNNINYIDYNTPENIYITKEEHERVKEIIENNCNEYEKEIFNMYFKEGKTVKEIARKFKYPTFLIEKYIKDILNRIKFILLSEEKYGKNDFVNNITLIDEKIIMYYVLGFREIAITLILHLDIRHVCDVLNSAKDNIDVELFRECYENDDNIKGKTFIK